MPYLRARQRRPALGAALALVLLLALAARGPLPAVAQVSAAQLVVERPTADSQVQGMLAIGGWAVDPTSRRGTGVAPDSVEIWLGPAGSGRWLGTAGYGDPRPDIAQRFGDPRFVPSGFRYFWDSCDAPAGPNVLTVLARAAGPTGRVLSATVPIAVGTCQLALGDMVEGRLITSGQADGYTFDGVAGERVSLTLDGFLLGGWDPFLELIAPNGTREDVDDDGGPDLDSWLSRRLAQTGTYTVRARPYNTDGCTGDYVALGWLGMPRSADPTRPATALGTSNEFRFRGSLREFGERQVWSFDAQPGDELILYLTRSLGSALDPYVELQGPDGQLLAQDDDSGGGLNSFLQGLLPQAGAYSVVARSAREDCGGDYVLRVERDWGAQSQVRGNLLFAETVSGSLSRTVRRDVWSFPAVAGERLTLVLDADGPTRLQVARPSGDWEQARRTRGERLGLSFEPAETGTYQAVVLVDTSQPIQYSLTLDHGYGPLVANKGPVALSQPVRGEIRLAGGRDLYTFEGRQGQQVRIALDRPGRSQLDPYLELLEPDGRTLAEDDDSGGELNALIQVILPRTGTYTVVARGFEDSAGPYVLTVTLGDGAGPGPAPTPPPPSPTPGTSPPSPPAPEPGPRP